MKTLINTIVDQGLIIFISRAFIKILFIKGEIINMNNIGIKNTINIGIITPTEINIHITEVNHFKSTKEEHQILLITKAVKLKAIKNLNQEVTHKVKVRKTQTILNINLVTF